MRRFFLFLAALSALALGDLALLVWCGATFGVLPVVAALVGTAILGVLVARAQGLAVFHGWLAAMADGETPAEGFADGLLVLLGGLLLVLPGLLGDVAGLVLLLPPVRRRLAERLRRRAMGWVRAGNVEVMTFSSTPGAFLFRDEDDHDDDVERLSVTSDGREVIDVVGEVVEERPSHLLGPGNPDKPDGAS